MAGSHVELNSDMNTAASNRGPKFYRGEFIPLSWRSVGWHGSAGHQRRNTPQRQTLKPLVFRWSPSPTALHLHTIRIRMWPLRTRGWQRSTCSFSLNVRPKVESITFTHFLLVRIKLHIHGWLQRRLRNIVLSIQLKIRGLIHTEEKRNTCWWPSSNLCDISMASFCSFALPRKPGLCSLLYFEGQVRCVVQTRICTGAINKESPGKHRKQK